MGLQMVENKPTEEELQIFFLINLILKYAGEC